MKQQADMNMDMTPCLNCGGIHFGNQFCPYAVPYDADDAIGEKRGIQQTVGTMHKYNYGHAKAAQ